jgi:serine/threonine-protein kinase
MIGTTIGPYRVVSRIGEGGMGVVYKAEHTTLGKTVAIKELLPGYAQDEQAVARFYNEAKAASAIRHPGIVDVVDCGRTATGGAYIIQEFLEGETLGARLRRGPLAVGKAVAVARQIAGALGAAHARKIVHRDLKPDNVMLVLDPEVAGGERAKILDFGIAKLAEDAGIVKTKDNSYLGTPVYMSPEQCAGRGASVDHRADVYALGVVLYEMLAGEPPFMAEGFGEILAMHMFQPPPPLRARHPAVPAALEAVVMRALEKYPEARWATMDALRDALAAVASDAPAKASVDIEADSPLDVAKTAAVAARPPSAPEVPSPSFALSGQFATVSAALRRRPRTLVAVGVGLLALPVAAIVLYAASGGARDDTATSGDSATGDVDASRPRASAHAVAKNRDERAPASALAADRPETSAAPSPSAARTALAVEPDTAAAPPTVLAEKPSTSVSADEAHPRAAIERTPPPGRKAKAGKKVVSAHPSTAKPALDDAPIRIRIE